ncbi:hypothetical protein HYV49_01080 [Candidatus Pacearchaeota archaeon]|nr:hypothetical protein [Candidatus Pacearchaeota archaeon]
MKTMKCLECEKRKKDELRTSKEAVALRKAAIEWAKRINIEPEDDEDNKTLTLWKKLAETAMEFSRKARGLK